MKYLLKLSQYTRNSLQSREDEETLVPRWYSIVELRGTPHDSWKDNKNWGCSLIGYITLTIFLW